jgi:hypothetical protein
MATPHEQGAIGTVLPPRAQEHAIEALANELHVDIDYVRSLYHSERQRLEAQARIKTYVSVIATRLVRNALTKSTFKAVQ